MIHTRQEQNNFVVIKLFFCGMSRIFLAGESSIDERQAKAPVVKYAAWTPLCFIDTKI
jgi:hypothetical protein